MSKLYWLDIETTGLDPEADQILEIAVFEAKLEAPYEAECIYNGCLEFHMSTWHRPMDPFVFAMHSKKHEVSVYGSSPSGSSYRASLFDECRSSTLSLWNAEQNLCARIPPVVDSKDKHILAGSCVHFDAGFLKKQMPYLAQRFAHRYFDTSAIKLFCQSLGMPKLEKAETHRASADVQESIAHAKACRDWLATMFRAEKP